MQTYPRMDLYMKHRKRRTANRRKVFWFGMALSLAGLIVLAAIPFFYLRSAYVGHQLLKQANAAVGNSVADINLVSPGSNATSNQTSPSQLQLTSETMKVPHFATGQLIGEVKIPALSLQAPLIQGTAAQQLEVAIGHLSTSVMPGKPGTTVIAAHNATWFRHVNELKTGAKIEVATAYGTFVFEVTQSKVVKVGAPISDTNNASIVLESCYPLDALYLTPYRYLVFGTLAQIVADSRTKPSTSLNQPYYYAVVPNDIAREGLTLSTNTLPMGTLKYTGSPGAAFTQSNFALSGTQSMIELYLAWLHAASDKNQTAIDALVPTGTPDPFYGVNRSHVQYLSNYDISLDVKGDKLISTTGTVRVQVGGTRYTIVLHGAAYGYQVKLTSIHVSS